MTAQNAVAVAIVRAVIIPSSRLSGYRGPVTGPDASGPLDADGAKDRARMDPNLCEAIKLLISVPPALFRCHEGFRSARGTGVSDPPPTWNLTQFKDLQPDS